MCVVDVNNIYDKAKHISKLAMHNLYLQAARNAQFYLNTFLHRLLHAFHAVDCFHILLQRRLHAFHAA